MSNIRLPEVRGEYRHNFNLAPITWFKVGGAAEILYKPDDIEDLQFFLKNIDEAVPITILGNCSNVIIRDGGIEGVIIKLGRNFAKIEQRDDGIYSGCGVLNSSLSIFAMQNSIKNLEFLTGIPGSVGGGIRMNAGAYGFEFKDIIKSFRVVDRAGEIKEFNALDVDFRYRECPLPQDFIFIDAIFKSELGELNNIKEKMRQINEQRSNTQPIKEKTGGSSFANPEGHKAWQLIDEVGLRGYKIGGAEFSSKHCNFMINTGDASAKDLEELGELAVAKVKKMHNVDLKWEIKRIGKYG